MLLLLLLSCYSRVRLLATMDFSLPGFSVYGIVQARVLSGLPLPSAWVQRLHIRTSRFCSLRGECLLLLRWGSHRTEDPYSPGQCPVSHFSLLRQQTAPPHGRGWSLCRRVEILNQGSWGTICGYNWSINDARMVCRQLGCGEALYATVSSSFGVGSGPIWLGNLKCTGKESHVWRCPSWGWGKHYCDHSLDAGVVCSGMVSSCPPAGRMESSKKAGVWSEGQ